MQHHFVCFRDSLPLLHLPSGGQTFFLTDREGQGEMKRLRKSALLNHNKYRCQFRNINNIL